MQQYLSGKTIVEKLSEDFEIIDTFITTCAQLPLVSYVDHVELRVPTKEMASLELPTVDLWKTVENLEIPSIGCTSEEILKTIED